MRILAIIALGLLTAACGFQLRGQAKLPFETLYVDMPANSPLGTELKRNISPAPAPGWRTAPPRRRRFSA